MTIRWLSGIRRVRIDQLSVDGAWRKRLELPRVAERAKSLSRLGLLQLPIVRSPDKRLLAGRDRVAALTLNGETHVDCRMVECSDTEAIEIASAENLERRHLTVEERDRELRELVDSLSRSIAEQQGLPLRGSGRRKTGRSEAIREIAERTGVPQGTVAKQLTRAESRAQEAQARTDQALGLAPDTPDACAPDAPQPSPECHIRTFGIELDAEWLRGVALHQGMVDDIVKRLKGAIRVTRELRSSKLPKRDAALDRLITTLEGSIRDARAARPSSLCPWCKGQSPAHEACAACCGTCLQLAGVEPQVPGELRNAERPVYYDHGVRREMLPEAPPSRAPDPEPPELPDQECEFPDPSAWMDFGNDDPCGGLD